MRQIHACVTGCLCVPADGESLGEREEWKDDSEDIVGRDTPTDHEPLKRDEPQVSECVCVCLRVFLLRRLAGNVSIAL